MTAPSAKPRLAIRVISLPGSTERRERMARQLDAAGLDWQFFDACTAPPPALPYDPARARIHRGRELTAGELGCFTSHWTVWEWFASAGEADLLLVMEDDLILDPVFFAELDKVTHALNGYDYMRLYAKVPAEIWHEALFLERHVARFRGKAYGTQAYFLTEAGARRFLQSIKRIERPIDDEMDRFWAHRVPIRAIFPFPVMEIQYGSTIESKRRSPEPLRGGERAKWLLSRSVEKLRRLVAGRIG